MSKPKTTKKKKATAKGGKTAPKAVAAKAPAKPKEKGPREELCVFAFRLTAEERTAIHKAAGPAKASKFARSLLVAAARNDDAAVKEILKGIRTKA